MIVIECSKIVFECSEMFVEWVGVASSCDKVQN